MSEPYLRPMPGRVIVKLVDRPDTIPGSEMLADSRYQYSPYIGSVVAIGDPLNEMQVRLCRELQTRSEAGERVVMTWGSGTDFTSAQMLEVRGKNGGDRFGWLGNLRVFRIEDFASTIVGGDELGGSDVPELALKAAKTVTVFTEDQMREFMTAANDAPSDEGSDQP